MGLQMAERGPNWINKVAAGKELKEKKEEGRKDIPPDKLTSVK